MLRRILASVSIGFCLSLLTTSAMATSQRTFVASNGNDANPCSLVLPCRGFAAAITQTSSGGEVIVLDSAGYGPVTITQPVSIFAPAGIYAGVSVSAGNGVTVNAPGSIVRLTGLAINGIGGGHGIVLQDASELYIERCSIANMAIDAINANSGSSTRLFVTDTLVRDNAYGVGIVGNIVGSLTRVRIERNLSTSLNVSNGANVTVFDSVFSQNKQFATVLVFSTGGTAATTTFILDSSVVNGADGADGIAIETGINPGNRVIATVVRSTVSSSFGGNGIHVQSFADLGQVFATIADNALVENQIDGIHANGVGVTVVASRNKVTGNGGYGLNQGSGATLLSTNDNLTDGNVLGPFIGAIGVAAAK